MVYFQHVSDKDSIYPRSRLPRQTRSRTRNITDNSSVSTAVWRHKVWFLRF